MEEINTIIHNRTSTEEQNPENQLKDCISIWKEEYGKYKIFEEKQSAWNDKKERPIFDEEIKLIKTGKIRHYISWDLDRIYRNRKKLKEFFVLCKIYKCKIHSFRQQWLEELNKIPEPFNDIMHELMLNLMGWLAEEESTKKSQRVKASIRHDNGITKSYKGNKWGRKAIKIDDKIIELNKQGKSMRDICKEVYYWDKGRHKKFVSLGYVQGVISNVHKSSQVLNQIEVRKEEGDLMSN